MDNGIVSGALWLKRVLSFALGEERSQTAAASLLRAYGSVSVIADVLIEDLARCEGMTPQAAILVKLCFYLQSRSITDKLKIGECYTEEQIEKYLAGLFLGLCAETLYLIMFDAKGRYIGTEFMGEGTVCSSDVYPRKLVECAIRRGAKAVIIAHNHPRGLAEPSREDAVATEMIEEVMRTSGVRFLGHYTVAGLDVRKVPTF